MLRVPGVEGRESGPCLKPELCVKGRVAVAHALCSDVHVERAFHLDRRVDRFLIVAHCYLPSRRDRVGLIFSGTPLR